MARRTLLLGACIALVLSHSVQVQAYYSYDNSPPPPSPSGGVPGTQGSPPVNSPPPSDVNPGGQSRPPPPPPVVDCSKPGAVCNDPILQGFNGKRFEFHGEVDSVYNLFSQKDVQVNARMVDVDDVVKGAGEDATFLGSIGFMHRSDRVAVEIVAGDHIQVTADGILMELEDMESIEKVDLADGTVVELFSHGKNVPDGVKITSPVLSVIIRGTGHHLDMLVTRVAGGLCGVHGALGQTYHRPAAGFEVEGQANDYLEGGLFSFTSMNSRMNKPEVDCQASHAVAEVVSVEGSSMKKSRKLMTATKHLCYGVLSPEFRAAENCL